MFRELIWEVQLKRLVNSLLLVAAASTLAALIVAGSASYPFMQLSAAALAAAIPDARHYTLQGQTHEVAAEALAPVLVEFFARGRVEAKG